MRRIGPGSLFLLPAAWLAVLVTDVLLRRVGMVATRPVLLRLRARIGRLPVAAALPLFLIPELCSRSGWVVSAWLILHGHAWRGLVVYVTTKLVAGLLALWICSAALPVLLRVPAFASLHGAGVQVRRRAGAWLRRRGGGRFAAAMAQMRARRLTAGNSAASPAPATPSGPAGPSRTG